MVDYPLHSIGLWVLVVYAVLLFGSRVFPTPKPRESKFLNLTLLAAHRMILFAMIWALFTLLVLRPLVHLFTLSNLSPEDHIEMLGWGTLFLVSDVFLFLADATLILVTLLFLSLLVLVLGHFLPRDVALALQDSAENQDQPPSKST